MRAHAAEEDHILMKVLKTTFAVRIIPPMERWELQPQEGETREKDAIQRAAQESSQVRSEKTNFNNLHGSVISASLHGRSTTRSSANVSVSSTIFFLKKKVVRVPS